MHVQNRLAPQLLQLLLQPKRSLPARRRYQQQHLDLTGNLVDQFADADVIVHAGDVGNLQVLETMAGIAPLEAVRGNNDVISKWPKGESNVCSALPDALVLDLSGGELVVAHGHQWPRPASRHQQLRKRWPAARCIVYGHSHRMVIDQCCEPWVINPGAAGRARAYGGAGWLGLTIERRQWRVTPNRFLWTDQASA